MHHERNGFVEGEGVCRRGVDGRKLLAFQRKSGVRDSSFFIRLLTLAIASDVANSCTVKHRGVEIDRLLRFSALLAYEH